MPLAITVSSPPTFDANTVTLRGKIVPSGTYPTGGDTLDFTKATFPPGQNMPPVLSIVDISIYSTKYNVAMFLYQWIRGTLLTNQLMGVFTGGAAQGGLAEFSTAAYTAAMLADTIEFTAIFQKAA